MVATNCCYFLSKFFLGRIKNPSYSFTILENTFTMLKKLSLVFVLIRRRLSKSNTQKGKKILQIGRHIAVKKRHFNTLALEMMK
jgi:hypothetical protein